MTTPFVLYAPQYWQNGLPAIPLTAPMDGHDSMGKRPVANSWSRWCTEMPPPEVQQEWLADKRAFNIGLALGPQSGVVVVDIDTYDPHLQRIIEKFIPASPWQRIGRKGAVYAFKYNGEKSFQIKGDDGKVIVEVLSQGRQVVLPPSIHPETKMPYTANVALYDCAKYLTTLPSDLEDKMRAELLRHNVDISATGHSSIIELTPVGTRDNRMMQEAGYYAWGIRRGSMSLLESFRYMDIWVADYTEKSKEDPLDPEKGKMRIVQYLTRDVKSGKFGGLPQGWDKGLTDEDKIKLGLTFTIDDEDWTYGRLMEWMRVEIVEANGNSEVISGVVNLALERLAKSESITAVQREQILGWIPSASRLKVQSGSLRRIYKDITHQDSIQGDNHTEIAAAVRESLELGSLAPVRFINGHFYKWDGSYWETMDEAKIKRAIAEDFGHLKCSVKNSDHVGILRVMQTICNDGVLRQDMEAGINFSNGYLTDSLVLKPHNQAFGCTYRLGYNYRPELEGEENCPLFMGMLDTFWGDDEDYQEKKQALREAIAATMFGVAPKFSRAMVLYNAAHGGKSTLIDVVKGLMPDGCTSHIPPADWSDKFKPAGMVGKMLNIGNDLSETSYINGEAFKIIVEGGTIQAQHKGQQVFEFRPEAAHWFATNHLPQSRDTSGGFLRRWLIFSFNKKVPPEKKIVHFALKVLAAERDAIAAWAVPAIRTLMERQDYDCPHSHFELLGEIANAANSVRHFLTASPKVSLKMTEVGKTVKGADLYVMYVNFCLQTIQKKPMSMKAFDLKMRELAPELGFKESLVDGVIEYEGMRMVA